VTRPRTPKTYVGENGRRKRICRVCKRHLALDARNFSPTVRGTRSGTGRLRRVKQWSYQCKRCATANKALWERKVRATKPEHYARVKARHLAYQKRWREENPEKVKAAAKRRAQAVKADPQRHARDLERRRIEHALRAERNGTPQKKKLVNAKRVRTSPRFLPAAPLLNLVDRILDRRRAVDGLLSDVEGAATAESVCADLGISSRERRHWRTGQQTKVRVGTAERILLNADVDWYEVYSYDDYAHIFLSDEVPA
jgi:hypothetical protein